MFQRFSAQVSAQASFTGICLQILFPTFETSGHTKRFFFFNLNCFLLAYLFLNLNQKVRETFNLFDLSGCICLLYGWAEKSMRDNRNF